MLMLPHIAKDGFRLRGTEMSRIDAFSDVVFGFALTLLVVSLEVPHTFSEMLNSVRGFVPFSICFLFLILLWYEHYRFFRRYGLHDALTIAINALLLFTMLFYIYPLKFLFTAIVGQMLHMSSVPVFNSYHQVVQLMVLYGAGFTAIYAIFCLLYANAWRQRHQLDLNPIERLITTGAMVDQLGMVAIGLAACAVALVLAPEHVGRTGLIFCTVALWKTVISRYYGHKIRHLRQTEVAQDEPAPSPAIPDTPPEAA